MNLQAIILYWRHDQESMYIGFRHEVPIWARSSLVRDKEYHGGYETIERTAGGQTVLVIPYDVTQETSRARSYRVIETFC